MSKRLTPSLKADILIIDDVPDNLRLLSQILSQYYKVRPAPSGTVGLTAIRSMLPDLILLDVMMPGMNGYEVAAQLKADKQTAEIPIIFISALDDTESKVKGFAAGGVDYVTKPFQEAEVLARVNTHLALRNLHKQVQIELAERKRAEENLHKREQEYKTLVENTPDVIACFDRQCRHTYVNPIVEKEFGISPEKLLGKSHRELGQSPEMADWSESMIRQVFETGHEVVFELTSPAPTGNKYYLSRGVPEFAEDGSVRSALFIHRNITERKQTENALAAANEELHRQLAEIGKLQHTLQEQAIRDSLTGLYNRHYMDEALTREHARAVRRKDPLSIVMIDMDGLKNLNDTYGHVAGDQAIKTLGDHLMLMTRKEDIVCRYGGDEFLVILYNTDTEDAYRRLAEWHRKIDEVRLHCQDTNLCIAFSSGVATYPTHGESIEEVVKVADKALYQVKKAKKMH